MLKVEGFSDDAAKINNAYAGAGTGNELIAGVYFYLNQIALDGLTELTRKRIESYLKYLRDTKVV